MYKAVLTCISIYLVGAAYLRLPGLNFYDSKRVLQLVLFTILGVTFLILLFISAKNEKKTVSILRGSNSFSLPSNSVVAFFFVLAFSGFISVMLSARPEYALLEYLFFFLLLTGAATIIPQNRKQHYYLGKAIFLSATLFSLIYLTLFFGNYISSFFDPWFTLWPGERMFFKMENGSFISTEFKTKEVLYFINRRFFNHVQTWTIPLLTGMLIFFKTRTPNRLLDRSLFFLISFWWMLVFASTARGTMFAVLISAFVIWPAFKDYTWNLVKMQFYTLITGGILYRIFYFFFVQRDTNLTYNLLRTSDQDRLNLLENALVMWLQHPFFGVGPLHYARRQDPAELAHPHNFYLQFLSEWGVIAFLALVALVIIFIRIVIKNYLSIQRVKPNQILYTAVVWSFTAGMIHAMLDGVMHTPLSQIWFILVFAWLLGYEFRNSVNTGRRLFNERFIKIIYIIILLSILYLIFIQVPISDEGYLHPRFWSRGHFE